MERASCFFRAEALLDRGAVLRMMNRDQEVGPPLLDEALELYARKGCVPSSSRLLAATGSSSGN